MYVDKNMKLKVEEKPTYSWREGFSLLRKYISLGFSKKYSLRFIFTKDFFFQFVVILLFLRNSFHISSVWIS